MAKVVSRSEVEDCVNNLLGYQNENYNLRRLPDGYGYQVVDGRDNSVIFDLDDLEAFAREFDVLADDEVMSD